MTDASLTSLRTPGLPRVLDDRINPILVKEVRQALRGRFFRVAFICTLAAVLIAAVSLVMGAGTTLSASEGRAFFQGIFFCLSIAVLAVVPFAAFTAMGAEWDENTYDLLIISNLRPRQIVLGKLLSAATQTLLFFSAFTPFVVFAFLLRGVDLAAILIVLAWTFVGSLAVALLALMLSTLTRNRFARVVLMVALGSALSSILPFSNFLASQAVQNSGALTEPDVLRGMLAALTVLIVACVFCFFAASNMLAHPEENRSTNVRVATTASFVLALVVFGWLFRSLGVNRETIMAFGCVALFVSCLPALFFSTEHEALGRRVAPRVPRSRFAALMVSPWLPGGARGAVLFLIHLGLITVWTLAMQELYRGPGRALLADGGAAFLASILYATIYVLLPSGLLAPFTKQPQMRAAVRLFLPLMVLLFAFAPALVGFFLDDRSLQRMEHPGNPAFLLQRAWDSGTFVFPGYWLVLLVLAGLGVFVNLPRLWRACVELLAASAARVERERALRPPEGEAGDSSDALAGA